MFKKPKHNLDYPAYLSSSITFGAVASMKKTDLNYMPDHKFYSDYNP